MYGFRLPEGHPLLVRNPFAHITGNRVLLTAENVTLLMTTFSTLQGCSNIFRFTIKGFDVFKGANGKELNVVVLQPTTDFVDLFAKLDDIAIPERDGNLYLYKPDAVEGAKQKTSHITLGEDIDGSLKALFNVGDVITASSIFAKREGKFDPFVSVRLQ